MTRIAPLLFVAFALTVASACGPATSGFEATITHAGQSTCVVSEGSFRRCDVLATPDSFFITVVNTGEGNIFTGLSSFSDAADLGWRNAWQGGGAGGNEMEEGESRTVDITCINDECTATEFSLGVIGTSTDARGADLTIGMLMTHELPR